MIDYSALLYDPIYAQLGVPATLLAVGTAGEIDLTVIDATRAKSNTTSGTSSVEVRSVGPSAFARIPELIAKGIAPDDCDGATLTFNGRTWIVRSAESRGSPNGEDLGEIQFFLRANA